MCLRGRVHPHGLSIALSEPHILCMNAPTKKDLHMSMVSALVRVFLLLGIVSFRVDAPHVHYASRPCDDDLKNDSSVAVVLAGGASDGGGACLDTRTPPPTDLFRSDDAEAGTERVGATSP